MPRRSSGEAARRVSARLRTGQPSRSTLSVSSATWARFDGSPSEPSAGCHVSRSKRLWSMAVVTPSFERAVMKNSMLRCRQACAICVEQPAASTRSCTRRGAGAPPLATIRVRCPPEEAAPLTHPTNEGIRTHRVSQTTHQKDTHPIKQTHLNNIWFNTSANTATLLSHCWNATVGNTAHTLTNPSANTCASACGRGRPAASHNPHSRRDNPDCGENSRRTATGFPLGPWA